MIKIICIGKLKEKYLIDGVNDYLKRLRKYHKIELLELPDSNINSEGNEIFNSSYLPYLDYNYYLLFEDISESSVRTKYGKTTTGDWVEDRENEFYEITLYARWKNKIYTV